MSDRQAPDNKKTGSFWSRLGLQVALIAILGVVALSFLTLGFLKRGKKPEPTANVPTKVSQAIAVPPESLEVGSLAWPTVASVAEPLPPALKPGHKFKFLDPLPSSESRMAAHSPSTAVSPEAGSSVVNFGKPHKFKYLGQATDTGSPFAASSATPKASGTDVVPKDSGGHSPAAGQPLASAEVKVAAQAQETKTPAKEPAGHAKEPTASPKSGTATAKSDKRTPEPSGHESAAKTGAKSEQGHSAEAGGASKPENTVKVPKPQWQSADMSWDKPSGGGWNPESQTTPDANWKQLKVGQTEGLKKESPPGSPTSAKAGSPEAKDKPGLATPSGQSKSPSAVATAPSQTEPTQGKSDPGKVTPSKTDQVKITPDKAAPGKTTEAPKSPGQPPTKAAKGPQESTSITTNPPTPVAPAPVALAKYPGWGPQKKTKVPAKPTGSSSVPTPLSGSSSPNPKTTARLTIINESGQAGRGPLYGDVLKAMGYNVDRVELGVPQPGPTTIYYSPGLKDEAEALAKRLPGQRTVAPLPSNVPGQITVLVR